MMAMRREQPLRRGFRERAAGRRGFTLIEIGVVLLVVGLLFGLALPSLQSVAGVQRRSGVARLAANIRATRGTAAMTGKTCRIAFDMDARSYLVECAEGRVQVGLEKSRNNHRDEDEEEVDLERMTEEEKVRHTLMKRATFAPSPTLASQDLPEGLEFGAIWTSHQDDEYTKGQAFLYFFPSGLAERANIQLKDGDDWYSLHVSPVAGRVRVYAEKRDLPDQDEDNGF